MIKDLDKILKVKWKLLVSFQTETLTEFLIQKNHWQVAEIFGLPYFRRLYNDNDIYCDITELEEMWQLIRQDINGWYKKIFKNLKYKSGSLLKYSKKISKLDLASLEQQELTEVLQRWLKLYGQNISLIGVPGRLDEVLEEEINKQLEVLNIPNQEVVYRLIAHSPKISGIMEEKIELAKIALTIKDINSKKAENKIRKHITKFQWLTCTLLLGNLYHYDTVKKELVELMNDSHLPKKIKEYQNSYKISQIELAKFKKQYSFPTKLNKLIKLLQEAVWFRTARLEWLNQACALARPLFYEIAKRIDISYEELIYLLPEEIISLLDNQIKNNDIRSVIKKRQHKYSMLTLDGKLVTLLLEDDVETLRQSLASRSVSLDTDIKGISASPGLVSGKVRLVKDRSEIGKIKQAEILVTKLTTPDFVPAMKKAAAIITDLGGITSHAAIVSRELGIPCIVGTKNATQLLKDGDFVEVDADRGIVKIIK